MSGESGLTDVSSMTPRPQRPSRLSSFLHPRTERGLGHDSQKNPRGRRNLPHLRPLLRRVPPPSTTLEVKDLTLLSPRSEVGGRHGVGEGYGGGVWDVKGDQYLVLPLQPYPWSTPCLRSRPSLGSHSSPVPREWMSVERSTTSPVLWSLRSIREG